MHNFRPIFICNVTYAEKLLDITWVWPLWYINMLLPYFAKSFMCNLHHIDNYMNVHNFPYVYQMSHVTVFQVYCSHCRIAPQPKYLSQYFLWPYSKHPDFAFTCPPFPSLYPSFHESFQYTHFPFNLIFLI